MLRKEFISQRNKGCSAYDMFDSLLQKLLAIQFKYTPHLFCCPSIMVLISINNAFLPGVFR